MPNMINERRRDRRIEDFNETTLSIMSGEKNLTEEKIFHNYSKDISESGARILTNNYLPVGTRLQLDLTLNNLHERIITFGKVKWIKGSSSDRSWDTGVEFDKVPAYTRKMLDIYISWAGMLYPA